jgi:hypothetical protein
MKGVENHKAEGMDCPIVQCRGHFVFHVQSSRPFEAGGDQAKARLNLPGFAWY